MERFKTSAAKRALKTAMKAVRDFLNTFKIPLGHFGAFQIQFDLYFRCSDLVRSVLGTPTFWWVDVVMSAYSAVWNGEGCGIRVEAFDSLGRIKAIEIEPVVIFMKETIGNYHSTPRMHRASLKKSLSVFSFLVVSTFFAQWTLLEADGLGKIETTLPPHNLSNRISNIYILTSQCISIV